MKWFSKLLRAMVLMVLVSGFLLGTTPVYADTPDPDSTPVVDQINVYRNLRETGDILFLVLANIPYSTIPDLPVTSTFIWRLIDTDNITELGSTVGTAFNVGTHEDDGYGFNVYSLYFSATEVTSLGIVWETAYTLRLTGNPAAFDDPPFYNFTINVVAYSTLTAQADVQAELAARILALAADLNNKWGLSATFSLLTEVEAGTVLSIFGEAFFRGAIFGLQSLAPTVFSVIIRDFTITEREWDPEYSENVTAQWGGTWIDTSQAAGKALFGTDYDLLSVIMLIAMSIGLLIGNVMITGDAWNGLIDVTVLGVIGARLGMYDFAFLLLVAALCWIYIGSKIWFRLFK